MFFGARKKVEMVARDAALPGSPTPLPLTDVHYLTGHSMTAVPAGARVLVVGMGCFWGAERRFWTPAPPTWALADGIVSTAVGYAGGFTPNPTYEEVCSGRTGHTEVVRIVWDPAQTTLGELLRRFWEGHDPTQGMRQGNDVGTQYRSALYVADEKELAQAQASRDAYAARLREAGLEDITTEVAIAGPFYFAEDYHQQYLAKNPGGYCGLGGTGVSCPAGLDA